MLLGTSFSACGRLDALCEHAVDEPLAPRATIRAGSEAGSRRCPTLSRIAALERVDRLASADRAGRCSIGRGSTQLRCGEHELEQQHRPALADVLDRLAEPLRRRPPGRPGGAEDRAVRPAGAGLVPGGDDQAALLEDLERPVDERTAPATRSSRARPVSDSCLANAQPCAGRSQSSASTAHSPGARSRSLTYFTVRLERLDRFSSLPCHSHAAPQAVRRRCCEVHPGPSCARRLGHSRQTTVLLWSRSATIMPRRLQWYKMHRHRTGQELEQRDRFHHQSRPPQARSSRRRGARRRGRRGSACSPRAPAPIRSRRTTSRTRGSSSAPSCSPPTSTRRRSPPRTPSTAVMKYLKRAYLNEQEHYQSVAGILSGSLQHAGRLGRRHFSYPAGTFDTESSILKFAAAAREHDARNVSRRDRRHADERVQDRARADRCLRGAALLVLHVDDGRQGVQPFVPAGAHHRTRPRTRSPRTRPR